MTVGDVALVAVAAVAGVAVGCVVLLGIWAVRAMAVVYRRWLDGK